MSRKEKTAEIVKFLVLTTAIIKGGTGKTTTAAALAQAAVKDGKRVLAIDLDPQANLSFILGADQTAPGAFQLLSGTPAAQLIQNTKQGMDVIPASPDLATVRTSPGSAMRLRDALIPIEGSYDIAVIDTPPTFGELTYNALQASHGLIIPMESDRNSLQGLYSITDIAHQMQRSNPALSFIGVIISRFDGRPKINRFLQDAIREQGENAGAKFLMVIRSGVAIREAQALQESIFDYAPKSKPAQDFRQLYELIKREV